jgi:outer membrane protein OmpA-like peptidoglycan-associated protein
MRPLIFLVFGLASIPALAQETRVSVYFDFNKYKLTENALHTLDSLVNEEKVRKSASTLGLSGHCDSIGPFGYNQELSRRRVFEVHNYLLNAGLPKTQFKSIDAYGESKPVNGNVSEEERALNRRVDIIFGETLSLVEKIGDTGTLVGTNIILKNINFFGGRADFIPESIPALNELLVALRQYPKLEIRVEGHICCQPGTDDGINVETGLPQLSYDRARTISNYLVTSGIKQERIQYRGFGHSNPIFPYPEQSEEERVLNRRVEIKILKK